MAEIPTQTGPVVVEDTDLSHLNALSTLTGRSHADLFGAAVERLRHDLVPSTRPVVERKRGPKAKS